MFDKKIFGERLLALRQQKNASQLVLAERLGVGKSAISMMESGQRAASADILVSLADYFGVSLDYLCGRTDNPEINR